MGPLTGGRSKTVTVMSEFASLATELGFAVSHNPLSFAKVGSLCPVQSFLATESSPAASAHNVKKVERKCLPKRRSPA